MSEHTPGPWHFEGNFVAGPNGECITYAVTTEANARLIAAAPDLLAACKPLRMAIEGAIAGGTENSHDTWGYLETLSEQAQAAIAKAS